MSKRKGQVIYRVSAIPRQDFPGFWRSGIFFPNAPDYVELTEEQMTDAIRNESMLIVQAVEQEDAVSTNSG